MILSCLLSYGSILYKVNAIKIDLNNNILKNK